MVKFGFSIIFFLVFFFQISVGQDYNTGYSALNYLASDELVGRFPGTDGDEKSAAYIADKFKAYGLKEGALDYTQEFNIINELKLNSGSLVKINGVELIPDNNYQPLSFSADVDNHFDIVYVKDIKDTSLILENSCALYRLTNASGSIPDYKNLIELGFLTVERGGKALIIVADNDLAIDSEYYSFTFNRSVSRLSIPVIQVGRETLVELANNKGYSGKSYNDSLYNFIETNENLLKIDLNLKIDMLETTTFNVVSLITVENSSDWMIIGAHYDHLGYGGKGSGSRAPELREIHNGADDNASGVAVVLMLAEYYSVHKPDMNIAFVLFGAEEQGLLGSRYFVNNLPSEIQKIKMMINFDMVGRLGEDGLSVLGATTAMEFDSLLNRFNSDTLKLNLGGGGFSGSDQASFYSEKIPVLFFTTGMHGDYHTPDDDVDKINFRGLHQIAVFSVKIINDFAAANPDLTFNQIQHGQGARHGNSMKVKLGIMPDMASRATDGLIVDGVTPGGVADRTGFVKGDKIVQLGESKVSGIYEYMHVMSEFNPGDKVKVQVIREGEIIELDIQF
jgi:hypothetical protein